MEDAKVSQDAPGWLIAAVAAALGSIIATALSPDPLFRLQGYIFTGAFTLAAFALNAQIAAGGFKADPTKYADGVIKAGVVSASSGRGRLAAGCSSPHTFVADLFTVQGGWLNSAGAARPYLGRHFAFGATP